MGTKYEPVEGYFCRARGEQRQRGYPRSRKNANRTLSKEMASLRMEVELMDDFLDAIERK